MQTEQRPSRLSDLLAVTKNAEAGLCADQIVLSRPRRGPVARAERFHGRPRTARQKPVDIGIVAVHGNEPFARHGSYQLMKLPDDRV